MEATRNPILEPREPGLNRHAFSGQCAPGGGPGWSSQQTFSVGIFQWVAKADGVGLKRGAVQVRVRGWLSEAEAVYAKAREIVAALDAGEYKGSKSVVVSQKAGA